MFGMGMWEIAVIAIVALLVVGPDKLPDAAKKISQGIRDFRKSTRELSKNIEEDTDLGSAVRDLKSALRGDEIRAAYQPPHLRKHTAKPPEGADGVPKAVAVTGVDPAPAEDGGDADPVVDDDVNHPAHDDDDPGHDPDLPVLSTPADIVSTSDVVADDEPDDDQPTNAAGKAHG